PDRVVWCAVLIRFDFFTPATHTRLASIIVDQRDPLFAVVGYYVTLEIHVLVTLDRLPWFALPTIRDHITASRFHNLSNLRIKRGLRLPSPELGLCVLNQLVQFFVCHTSEIHGVLLIVRQCRG